MSDIIEQLGGVTAVAKICGVTVPSVISWRRRSIPSERCPVIERGTNGQVPVEQLRPDVRWARVEDALWPHPKGRPCIDPCGPAPIGDALAAQDRRAA